MMVRQQRKKKKSKAPFLIVFALILVFLCAAAYFGYKYWISHTHPIKYSNYVERYANEYNVDKYFVYAVIKTESGFDPSAVSSVGARGLMQIMEDTFDWIKFKLDDEDTEYANMFIAEDNIRYGCFFLGYLYNEFGNIETAAAAYHAGRGSVNSWLKDPQYSSDGIHLDNIPIKDTAHYVNKITKAMDIYIELYDNQNQ